MTSNSRRLKALGVLVQVASSNLVPAGGNLALSGNPDGSYLINNLSSDQLKEEPICGGNGCPLPTRSSTFLADNLKSEPICGGDDCPLPPSAAATTTTINDDSNSNSNSNLNSNSKSNLNSDSKSNLNSNSNRRGSSSQNCEFEYNNAKSRRFSGPNIVHDNNGPISDSVARFDNIQQYRRNLLSRKNEPDFATAEYFQQNPSKIVSQGIFSSEADQMLNYFNCLVKLYNASICSYANDWRNFRNITAKRHEIVMQLEHNDLSPEEKTKLEEENVELKKQQDAAAERLPRCVPLIAYGAQHAGAVPIRKFLLASHKFNPRSKPIFRFASIRGYAMELRTIDKGSIEHIVCNSAPCSSKRVVAVIQFVNPSREPLRVKDVKLLRYYYMLLNMSNFFANTNSKESGHMEYNLAWNRQSSYSDGIIYNGKYLFALNDLQSPTTLHDWCVRNKTELLPGYFFARIKDLIKNDARPPTKEDLKGEEKEYREFQNYLKDLSDDDQGIIKTNKDDITLTNNESDYLTSIVKNEFLGDQYEDMDRAATLTKVVFRVDDSMVDEKVSEAKAITEGIENIKVTKITPTTERLLSIVEQNNSYIEPYTSGKQTVSKRQIIDAKDGTTVIIDACQATDNGEHVDLQRNLPQYLNEASAVQDQRKTPHTVINLNFKTLKDHEKFIQDAKSEQSLAQILSNIPPDSVNCKVVYGPNKKCFSSNIGGGGRRGSNDSNSGLGGRGSNDSNKGLGGRGSNDSNKGFGGRGSNDSNKGFGGRGSNDSNKGLGGRGSNDSNIAPTKYIIPIANPQEALHLSVVAAGSQPCEAIVVTRDPALMEGNKGNKESRPPKLPKVKKPNMENLYKSFIRKCLGDGKSNSDPEKGNNLKIEEVDIVKKLDVDTARSNDGTILSVLSFADPKTGKGLKVTGDLAVAKLLLLLLQASEDKNKLDSAQVQVSLPVSSYRRTASAPGRTQGSGPNNQGRGSNGGRGSNDSQDRTSRRRSNSGDVSPRSESHRGSNGAKDRDLSPRGPYRRGSNAGSSPLRRNSIDADPAKTAGNGLYDPSTGALKTKPLSFSIDFKVLRDAYEKAYDNCLETESSKKRNSPKKGARGSNESTGSRNSNESIGSRNSNRSSGSRNSNKSSGSRNSNESTGSRNSNESIGSRNSNKSSGSRNSNGESRQSSENNLAKLSDQPMDFKKWLLSDACHPELVTCDPTQRTLSALLTVIFDPKMFDGVKTEVQKKVVTCNYKMEIIRVTTTLADNKQKVEEKSVLISDHGFANSSDA